MKSAILIFVLLAILGATFWWAIYAWNTVDVEMSVHGYVAMTLGIIFSLLVGCGLMALMFYSSRHGYDEPFGPFNPKGVLMGDVEKEMDALQRKLATKTREIEALVAKQQRLSDLSATESSTDYARLRTYVEELIYKWQEANVQAPGSNPDTAVNRLIAER